jgi:hypothetical protein
MPLCAVYCDTNTAMQIHCLPPVRYHMDRKIPVLYTANMYLLKMIATMFSFFFYAFSLRKLSDEQLEARINEMRSLNDQLAKKYGIDRNTLFEPHEKTLARLLEAKDAGASDKTLDEILKSGIKEDRERRLARKKRK